MTRQISLILAATYPAFGIGLHGTMPWRLSQELKYFRQVTEHSTVIMGRKTWDSIPPQYRPLRNRTNIVVSRTPQNYGDQVKCFSSIEEAINSTNNDVFIIGGSQIYSACLPYASRLYITLISDPESKITCDTFFKFDASQWHQQPTSELAKLVNGKVKDFPTNGEVEENGLKYKFSLFTKH